MLRFYVDEALAEDLAEALRRLGYDAVNTRQVGNKGWSDPRQLSYAAQHGRALVTCNRGDFEMLHEAWLRWAGDWHVAARHSGILVVPNGNVATAEVVSQAIDDLANAAETIDNRLFVWTRRYGWRERA